MRLSSKTKTIIAFVSLLGLFGLYLVYDNATQEVDENFEVAKLKSFINHELKSADGFTASNLQIEDEKYEVKYSINRDLQKYIKRRSFSNRRINEINCTYVNFNYGHFFLC